MIKSISSLFFLALLFSASGCIKRNPQIFTVMAGKYEWTTSHSNDVDNNGNPLPDLNAETFGKTYQMEIKRNGEIILFEDNKELGETEIMDASGELSDKNNQKTFIFLKHGDFNYYNVELSNGVITCSDWPHVYYKNSFRKK